MSTFIEGKPEVFLATVAERFPHSEPILATFRRFSNSRTYQARIEPLGEDQIYPELIAKPKDPKARGLLMILVPGSMGPIVKMSIKEDTGWYPRPTHLEIITGWNPVGYPDTESNGWRRDFDNNMEVPYLNPLSESGKWVQRVMRYFSRRSEQYFKDGYPQVRITTMEEVEKEPDWSTRRFLAALEEKGFADLSAVAALI